MLNSVTQKIGRVENVTQNLRAFAASIMYTVPFLVRPYLIQVTGRQVPSYIRMPGLTQFGNTIKYLQILNANYKPCLQKEKC